MISSQQYESACGIIVMSPYFIIAITLGSVLFLNLWMGVLTRYNTIHMYTCTLYMYVKPRL